MAKPKRVLYVCRNHTATNPHPTKRMFEAVELQPHRNAMSRYIFRCIKCGGHMEQRPDLDVKQTSKKKKGEDLSSLIAELQDI